MIGVQTSLVEEQLEMSKYIGKRKHYTHLTDCESSLLKDRLTSISKWGISTHTFDRMKEKSINATYNDIVSTAFNCDIIEYKIDYNKIINRCEERLLVRGRALVNKFYNLNVVYSLTSNRVVTVWLNSASDSHDTLDWSLYDEGMKVFK